MGGICYVECQDKIWGLGLTGGGSLGVARELMGRDQTQGRHAAFKCVSPSPEMGPGAKLPLWALPVSAKGLREAQVGHAEAEAGMARVSGWSSRYEWGWAKGEFQPLAQTFFS